MIYVMSDIHGNMERFNHVLKQIDFKDEDTLYILGDVIDRFPDGIKILNRIMKMSNVKMLMGNHEYMMLKALYSDGKGERINLDNLNLWYRNNGAVSHNSLKHMRKENKRAIFEYLSALPFNIDIEVNNIKYKLIHGSPIENYEKTNRGVFYLDEEEFAVWERWAEHGKTNNDYTIIFGHTPTPYFDNTEPWKIWKGEESIGIDCGCGYPQGRLACLRLDDMKEFYSEDKELINLEWIVYKDDVNRKQLRPYNIFNHSRFMGSVQTLLKKCKTKEDFAEKIRMELRYNFWSKSEYEVIISKIDDKIIMSPWIGNDDIRIDVTNDDNFDWLGFYDSLQDKCHKNRIKIDIYDQVNYRFDEFVNYVWYSRKRRESRKSE